MHDDIHITGEYEIIHKDRYGNIKERFVISNLVVNSGKEQIAKLINGISTAYFNRLQIGTGTVSPTVVDTALNQFYMEGVATRTYETNKSVFKVTFMFNEHVFLSEAGVFNGVRNVQTPPVMLSRGVFAPREVQPEEAIEVTWKVTVN